MAEHLNREQIIKYRDRELEPAELIEADAHLSRCAECRAAAADIAIGGGLIAAVGAASSEHLSYEQMDAWVDDQLDPSERELVLAHIGLCSPCARQLRDYETYAPAMSAAIPPPARESTTWADRLRAFFRSPRFAMMVTAALVVVVLSPLVMRQSGHPAILDSLYGPSRPQSLSDLPVNADSTLLYPVSETIEERQPIFEWVGNEPVQVFIFDAAHREVAHSDTISGAMWLAPVPLDRGAVYTWEVRTAAPGGGAADQASSRQGSFRVLSEADHEKLASARASKEAPLQVGEMARDMGALSLARQDFQMAVRANPADRDARHLLDQVEELQGRAK